MPLLVGLEQDLKMHFIEVFKAQNTIKIFFINQKAHSIFFFFFHEVSAQHLQVGPTAN
jgi:hypothetical protein